MPINLNNIGGLISKLPGGKEAVGLINDIGNPIMQVAVNPFVNMGSNMLHSIMSMQKSLMKSGSKIADGLAGFVSSPMFMYLVVGGLAIGGIMVIQNGGNAPLPPQVAKLLGK